MHAAVREPNFRAYFFSWYIRSGAFGSLPALCAPHGSKDPMRIVRYMVIFTGSQWKVRLMEISSVAFIHSVGQAVVRSG